jgi:hypothetical protein
MIEGIEKRVHKEYKDLKEKAVKGARDDSVRD